MIPALALAFLLSQAQAPAPQSAPATAKGTQLTVTKASVYLVQKPSFLAPRASTSPVHRGQKVTVEAPQKGSWLEVSVRQGGKKVTGFVHASYVSDRKVAFKMERKEVEGPSTVSAHYNLAVGGFREEVARGRQATSKDTQKGYALIERYMPLQVEDRRGRPLSRAARARLLPPDADGLRKFLEDGDLRRQERPQAATAEGGADADETAPDVGDRQSDAASAQGGGR